MRNFTKKILIGLLGSALIFTGSQAMAAPPEMPEHGKNWQKEAATNIDGWSKYFSEKYGVDSAQIEKAFKDGVHIDDIRSAAVLAKLSGKSFSDVLAMKVDWPQVAEKLGVTRDQLKEFNKQEREKMLVERTGLDIQTLNSLRKEGYNPRDIGIAAKIAKASNQDIKTVLAKRTINNTWNDVAKTFGVDMKEIMPPPHGHHGHQLPPNHQNANK